LRRARAQRESQMARSARTQMSTLKRAVMQSQTNWMESQVSAQGLAIVPAGVQEGCRTPPQKASIQSGWVWMMMR